MRPPLTKLALVLLLLIITFASSHVLGQLKDVEKNVAVTSTIQAQDRELIVNKVPKHLPIKFEILYGKRTQVLENAEIKVTNTGARPIYYLDFIVGTGRDSGLSIDYGISWLRFGRNELVDWDNRATSGDPFLAPGETYTFALGKKNVDGFRKARAAQQVSATKYELIIQQLNFGDGTGFWTTGGVPFPRKKEVPFVNATDRRRQPFFFENRD